MASIRRSTSLLALFPEDWDRILLKDFLELTLSSLFRRESAEPTAGLAESGWEACTREVERTSMISCVEADNLGCGVLLTLSRGDSTLVSGGVSAASRPRLGGGSESGRSNGNVRMKRDPLPSSDLSLSWPSIFRIMRATTARPRPSVRFPLPSLDSGSAFVLGVRASSTIASLSTDCTCSRSRKRASSFLEFIPAPVSSIMTSMSAWPSLREKTRISTLTPPSAVF